MKFLYLLFIAFLIHCGSKAEVTWDSAVYKDPELKEKIKDIKKGTLVDALDFKNHAWGVRDSIRIKTDDGTVGFITPSHVVVGQDPAKSVFKWGYRKEYKKFYDPKNKKHYKEGYEYPDYASLPKEKVSLDELLKDTKLD
jgi:hypothetical protein